MNCFRSGLTQLSLSILLTSSLSVALHAGEGDEGLSPAIQERLHTIRCLAAQDRAGIDSYYGRQLRALLVPQRLIVERLVKAIPRFERILWLERLRAERGQRSSTRSIMKIPAPGFWNESENIRRYREMVESYSLRALTDLLLEAESTRVLTEIANNYREPAALRHAAAKLIRETRSYRYQQAVERLLEEQQNRLRFVNEWEVHSESIVLTSVSVQPEGIEPATDAVRLVAIIGDAQSGYACAIRGVDDLLRRGDRFEDITVEDVQEGHVSLVRAGERWQETLD